MIAALAQLTELTTPEHPEELTRVGVFQGYVGVFIIAFAVTLLATPLMRRLAVANGIVDHPSDARKVHRQPIAYLGGAAVYLGLLGALIYAVFATEFGGLIDYHATEQPIGMRDRIVPLSILLGLTVIMLVGLLDDVIGISPRLKIAGQLFAAAALALDQVGVKVAGGLIFPIAKGLGVDPVTINGQETIGILFGAPVPALGNGFDLVYWTGAVVIALFVLGGCNASNLIDGLDGLLSGVTAIAVAGILFVALSLAVMDDGPRDTQRIILALAVLGACLGFLPHNFNPANIFLGDCGSLLLGYCAVVLILMLGDTGKTHLVVAGLVIYAIPIMDTTLAIIRRKLSGLKMSDADSNHLHHMLKRSLGVKGAVLALYGIGGAFALLGVAASLGRARVIYALILILASYIVVTAVKIARRAAIEAEAASALDKPRARARAGLPPLADEAQPENGAQPPTESSDEPEAVRAE